MIVGWGRSSKTVIILIDRLSRTSRRHHSPQTRQWQVDEYARYDNYHVAVAVPLAIGIDNVRLKPILIFATHLDEGKLAAFFIKKKNNRNNNSNLLVNKINNFACFSVLADYSKTQSQPQCNWSCTTHFEWSLFVCVGLCLGKPLATWQMRAILRWQFKLREKC